MGPITGALIGGGTAQAATLTSKYLLPTAESKRWASVIGLGVGLGSAGALWWLDGTESAISAAVTAALATVPRAAEAFFLPKPAGGHDLAALTVEELRAVVATEQRTLSGPPANLLGQGRLGPAAGGISPQLSSAFGRVPLSGMSR